MTVTRADTPLRRFVADYLTSPLAVVAGLGLAVIVLLAVFAGQIAPQNPYDLVQITIFDGSLPPGELGFEGFRFWLGSDEQGRDMLSAMIYGLRISLFVSFVAVGSAVLAEIAAPGFLERVQAASGRLRQGLETLATRHGFGRVRGEGLLLALDLGGPTGPRLVDAALPAGLLINAPRPDTLRFMPALTIADAEIDQALAMLDATCRQAL